MINILLLTILFISNAWSLDRLELVFQENEVHQGALVRGKLLLQPDSINLPVQKLKAATIGETIYFQQLSPLLKKDGSSSYESDIKVIFVKLPEAESITGTIGQNEVLINIGAIKVIPIESSGQMEWADFTAPDFLQGSWKSLWITLIIILLGVGSFLLWRKISARRKVSARRKQLLEDFKSCTSYEEVVSMWQKKRIFFQEFPQLESNFSSFEEVLFRYQFKPKQTDTEKQFVLEAYRKLLSDNEGVFRGI